MKQTILSVGAVAALAGLIVGLHFLGQTKGYKSAVKQAGLSAVHLYCPSCGKEIAFHACGYVASLR